MPSSHVVPLTTLFHALVLRLGWHDWHALLGFCAPLAQHAPAMRQLFGASGCVQLPAVQTRSEERREGGVHAVPSVLLVALQPPEPSHEDVAWHSLGVHV